MAKYCSKCGQAMAEGAKFCPACGTPVTQTAQQPVQQPGQNTQPQVKTPALSAQKSAAMVSKQTAPGKRKKGKGGLITVFAILFVVVIGVVGVFGFRDGGWFRKMDNPQGRPTTYDGQNSIDAIIDYANRLEAAGNEEAAAIVRSRIPQAAAGEANQKIEEFRQNNEDWQMIENIEDAVRIADALGGK